MAQAQYEVIGELSIRDAVTRESVPQGGVVTLDDEPVARVDDAGRPTKPLAATNVAVLIGAGLIKPVETPKGRKD